MNHASVVSFLVQITLMLGITLVIGKLLHRFSVMAMVCELLGGVLLGPTVFGTLAPHLYETVFNSSASANLARQTVTTAGLVLFVFLAGLEVHPASLRKQGRAIVWTSASGILLPFAVGAVSVALWPSLWGGSAGTASLVPLALFVGTILSISALPVIARIMMDLNVIKTELGVTVMSAAMLDDVCGWALFALLLSYFGHQGAPQDFATSAALVVSLVVLALGVSNSRVQRAVTWLDFRSDNLLLRLTIVVVLIAGTLSEVIGTHATMGAFLVGVSLARVPLARDQAFAALHGFTMGFFAPLYFVSIGLQANFIRNFDLRLVLFVLVVSSIGKIGGVMMGARIGGKTRREAALIAVAMNARGAMGIVLTSLALEFHLINERVFVALVVQAVATSVLSAQVIKRFSLQPLPAKAVAAD